MRGAGEGKDVKAFRPLRLVRRLEDGGQWMTIIYIYIGVRGWVSEETRRSEIRVGVCRHTGLTLNLFACPARGVACASGEVCI